MIDLRYSLVIEATEEPDFFSFYSPDLKGFSGVGHSVRRPLRGGLPLQSQVGDGGARELAGGTGSARPTVKLFPPGRH
jgi:hypothetical protein